jgi:hypothetical protein
MKTIDIGYKSKWPGNQLSNFIEHHFEIDEVRCNSMEGFLQSLKFKEPAMQEHVCTLIGVKAKYKGKHKSWWKTQTLWWKGEQIDRHSPNYQSLLDRAYKALSNNPEFVKALLATEDCELTHTIGNTDSRRTVLTRNEFISRLKILRKSLKKKKR